jgi:hypothetical protein
MFGYSLGGGRPRTRQCGSEIPIGVYAGWRTR